MVRSGRRDMSGRTCPRVPQSRKASDRSWDSCGKPFPVLQRRCYRSSSVVESCKNLLVVCFFYWLWCCADGPDELKARKSAFFYALFSKMVRF